MLNLAAATNRQFAPCVGQDFDLVLPSGPVRLVLEEVRPSAGHPPDAKRTPFALILSGPPALLLSQGIFRLENATIGAMEIFLVQVAANASASQFEAIFN